MNFEKCKFCGTLLTLRKEESVVCCPKDNEEEEGHTFYPVSRFFETDVRTKNAVYVKVKDETDVKLKVLLAK